MGETRVVLDDEDISTLRMLASQWDGEMEEGSLAQAFVLNVMLAEDLTERTSDSSPASTIGHVPQLALASMHWHKRCCSREKTLVR